MRLQVLSKDSRVLARVRRFDEKLKAARGAAERGQVLVEWQCFLRAMNLTGVFKVEG